LVMADERIEREADIQRSRQRAEQCRAMAVEAKSPQARLDLLDMARTYDDMADRLINE
jgi:hypothetical protein